MSGAGTQTLEKATAETVSSDVTVNARRFVATVNVSRFFDVMVIVRRFDATEMPAERVTGGSNAVTLKFEKFAVMTTR